MSGIDARLAPVLANERSSARGTAVFGLVLVGLAALMLFKGLERPDAPGQAIAVVMGLVFGLPGVWLIAGLFRGPERAAIVRLLTVDRGKIESYDFEYVSIQHGPTRTRIKLFLAGGRYREVTLAPQEAKGVMAYVAESVPRRGAGGG